uniref:RNA-binding protein 42 n=1 Tax=Petromyzon marinus TaxID=7757 RepID=S4RWB8_PETMA
RPVISSNTYHQVQQSLLQARAAAGPIPMPPLPPFVPPMRPPPRPAFVPHVLLRPVLPHCSHALLPYSPRVAAATALSPRPPLLRPPLRPPPFMPMPPRPHGMMGPPPPIGPMGLPPGPPMGGMMSSAVVEAPPKLNPSVIQAGPTVYLAAPVKATAPVPPSPITAQNPDCQVDDSTIIGPVMPPPAPHEPPIANSESSEEKPAKKNRPEKVKKILRSAAGITWEDASLMDWDPNDFRIFCGDLGNEVSDDTLARAFSRYPTFLRAKVVRDKRSGKTKGYGFVSFKDPNDFVRAMREMNGVDAGKYVGSRPIKLRKSTWRDRNMDIVRKKNKEKKKLGLK